MYEHKWKWIKIGYVNPQKLYQLKIWLPVTKLFPIRSLPRRYQRKLNLIFENFVYIFGPILHFSGMTIVAQDQGLTTLKLHRKSPLGPKGTLIKLPEDQVIYRKVKQLGQWELAESEFLAEGLKSAYLKSNLDTVLIDIGAHVGLVSLQAINIAKTSSDVVLFEPFPKNITSLKYNMANSCLSKNITIHEFALADTSGKTTMFIDTTNFGKSSINKSKFNSNHSLEIEMTNTAKFFNNSIKTYDNYVIKCDAEGSDAVICANIPKRIWEKTICATIEISAWNTVKKKHVDHLCRLWGELFTWSWQGNLDQISNYDEVKNFWTGKSQAQKNLFLRQRR